MRMHVCCICQSHKWNFIHSDVVSIKDILNSRNTVIYRAGLGTGQLFNADICNDPVFKLL